MHPYGSRGSKIRIKVGGPKKMEMWPSNQQRKKKENPTTLLTNLLRITKPVLPQMCYRLCMIRSGGDAAAGRYAFEKMAPF